MKELYFVQTLDLWSNVYLIGLFDDIKKAEAIIKRDNADFPGIEDLELKVVTGSFSRVFDQELYDRDTGEFLRIFGYVLYTEEENPTGYTFELEKEDAND